MSTATTILFFLTHLMLHGWAFGLRFRPDGQFKVVQIADMHYGDGDSTECLDVEKWQHSHCTDLNTTAFLSRIIAVEQPDLVVFTGDNIFGMDTKNPEASLNACFAPVIDAKLPWAAVLGNHDHESKQLSRKQVMELIVKMDYTLSKVYPDEDYSTIDGFGNYNLEVGGVSGSEFENKSILNLYFLDSGDYSNKKKTQYAWIQESQKSWFKHVSAKLQESHKAPGLAYFHIPLPEVKMLRDQTIVGVRQEIIGCPNYNSLFFKTMVEAGDVKAAFFGHDHMNDFCGTIEGIKLCYGGGFGYHAYGKAGWARRARVVAAYLKKDHPGGNGTWKGVERIMTWKRLDDTELSKIDEEIVWNGVETFSGVELVNPFDSFC